MQQGLYCEDLVTAQVDAITSAWNDQLETANRSGVLVKEVLSRFCQDLSNSTAKFEQDILNCFNDSLKTTEDSGRLKQRLVDEIEQERSKHSYEMKTLRDWNNLLELRLAESENKFNEELNQLKQQNLELTQELEIEKQSVEERDRWNNLLREEKETNEKIIEHLRNEIRDKNNQLERERETNEEERKDWQQIFELKENQFRLNDQTLQVKNLSHNLEEAEQLRRHLESELSQWKEKYQQLILSTPTLEDAQNETEPIEEEEEYQVIQNSGSFHSPIPFSTSSLQVPPPPRKRRRVPKVDRLSSPFTEETEYLLRSRKEICAQLGCSKRNNLYKVRRRLF